MTTQTIRELLGLRNPKEYKFLKESGGIDPGLLFGVELEIEGMEADEDQRANRVVAGMQYHKDGSLRNNGGEFVTLPMNFINLEKVLNTFFEANEFTDENYSERCSVHVHANCQDLDLNQLKLVLCVYQVVEKLLFQYIGMDRDKNIFCVPLCESNLGANIMMTNEDFLNMISRQGWRKYTSLNLLPLVSQGTIEFRHMAGTKDVDFILQWASIISCMFKYARNNKFDDVIKEIKLLNTSSAYATFMQSIFDGNLCDALTVGPWREYLEEGVISMKCMLAHKKKSTLSWSEPEMVGFGLNPIPVQARDPRLPPVLWNRDNQPLVDRANLERLADGDDVMTGAEEAQLVERLQRERQQMWRARQNQAIQAGANDIAGQWPHIQQDINGAIPAAPVVQGRREVPNPFRRRR